jgi:hypothetical protein
MNGSYENPPLEGLQQSRQGVSLVRFGETSPSLATAVPLKGGILLNLATGRGR